VKERPVLMRVFSIMAHYFLGLMAHARNYVRDFFNFEPHSAGPCPFASCARRAVPGRPVKDIRDKDLVDEFFALLEAIAGLGGMGRHCCRWD
jgi:hypothetical protein